MLFYLDDCADSNLLIRVLQNAGHDVRTPRTENMRGADDADHLAYAAENECVLITKNPRDFEDLHDEYQLSGQAHSGILMVYQDSDSRKNMSPTDILGAIQRMIDLGVTIENELHNLNHWRVPRENSDD
jgi:predicted nuclease of predicted toxin-antitoxin system